VEILRALRKGEFDVLVGINLLREGLDLPEVSLVAILDADKEGFLRSTTSLIQTAGRASRHINGEVILYADVMTRSIKEFLAQSSHRRERQLKHNKANGITPRSVSRAVEDSLADRQDTTDKAVMLLREGTKDLDISVALRDFEAEMIAAAENLEFEKAAHLRDQINQLKRGLGEDTIGPKRKVKYQQGKRRRTVK
jgi:excinuclease ABC subunit B